MVNNKLIDELTNQYSIEVKDLVKWFLDEFRDEIETITDEEFAKVIKGISCLCDKRRNIDDIKTHLKRKFEHTKAAYIIKALENYKYYIPRTINDFLDGYVPTTIFAGGKIKVRSLFLTCFKVIINCFSSQGRFRNILTYYAAKHPKRKAVSERNYRSRNIKEKRKDFTSIINNELKILKISKDFYKYKIFINFKRYVSHKFKELEKNCKLSYSLKLESIKKTKRYFYFEGYWLNDIKDGFRVEDLFDLYYTESINKLMKKLKRQNCNLDIDKKRNAIIMGKEERITYDGLKKEFLNKMIDLFGDE